MPSFLSGWQSRHAGTGVSACGVFVGSVFSIVAAFFGVVAFFGVAAKSGRETRSSANRMAGKATGRFMA